MRKWSRQCAVLLLAGVSGMASAQLGLPGVGGVVARVGATLSATTQPAFGVLHDAGALVTARLTRLGDFVRRNRATVDLDDADQPARARELLLLDPDAASLQRAAASGYGLIEAGNLGGLDVPYARLATPPGTSLAAATRQLRRLLPGKDITADQIHFVSGVGAPAVAREPAADLPRPTGGTVGIIDGGVSPGPGIIAQAGFASGAPRPDAHAQEIASLLRGAGTAHIYVADVYGADPAGGSALAIAKALGWMSGQTVAVVSISLIGPPNPLLARAIAATQAKGMIITAAVGNDGAAAPAAYPASYPGVIAVTGVDRRGHVLFEAGRASHLDYAAPGADLTAIGLDHKAKNLRGTSFAAPLVAARIAAHGQGRQTPAAKLGGVDAEAVNKSARTGRGIVCGPCRAGI